MAPMPQSWPLFAASLLLWTCQGANVLVPHCVYQGRELNGPGDFDNITSACRTYFGDSFSAAFQARFDALELWTRVLEVREFARGDAFFCGSNNVSTHVSCEVVGKDGSLIPLWVPDPPVLGELHQYLFTVRSGLARLFVDGVKVAEVSDRLISVPWVQHSIVVGRHHKGSVRDVWLWPGEVDWSATSEVDYSCTRTSSTSSTTSVTSTSTTSASSTTTTMTSTTSTASGTSSSTTSVSSTTSRSSTTLSSTTTVTTSSTSTGSSTSSTSSMTTTGSTSRTTTATTTTATGTATMTTTKTGTATTRTGTSTTRTGTTTSKTGTTTSKTGTTTSKTGTTTSKTGTTTTRTRTTTTPTITTTRASSVAAGTSAAPVDGNASPATSFSPRSSEAAAVASFFSSASSSLAAATTTKAPPADGKPRTSTPRSVPVTTVPIESTHAAGEFSEQQVHEGPSTTTSRTTTLSATTTTQGAAPQDVKDAIIASVQGAVALLENETRVSLQTSVGELTVLSLAAVASDAPQEIVGGSQVALSQSFLVALPPGAALAGLGMSSESQEALQKVGGDLAVPALDLTILLPDGSKLRSLPEPLLFKLPDGGVQVSEPSCVYLAEEGGQLFWSTEGVRRATPEEILAAGGQQGGVWCVTVHLSIFSALIQAALGCTNMELLTHAGMQALMEHEGWWKTKPAALTFFVLVALFTALFGGMMRECWEMRLGRTHEDGKAVRLCNALVQCGPQVLKHRYAAFVVYAKDLVQCLAKGRKRLRKPTLLSGVQRILAVRSGISTACVTQHCWSGGQWVETQASLPHYVLAHKLQYHSGEAMTAITRDLKGLGPLHMLRRFVLIFLAVHPLLDSLRLGASSTSVKKRATMQVAAFLGVLATNALIFNFSGSQSWESDFDCPIEPTSQLFIVVATIISVLVNVVPNTFLANVAKQVHGRPLWQAGFWGMAYFYLAVAGWVVMIALANLNSKDQSKWHASMQWSLIIKLLGMPTAQALRNFIMLEHFLREDDDCNHIEQTLGLRHQEERDLDPATADWAVQLASRGISAEELLQFTALLGKRVMLDYSPETSTSEEVLRKAIRHFGQEPSDKALSLEVEVADVLGLQADQCQQVKCTVLHLSTLASQQRTCVEAHSSELTEASLTETSECVFSWPFQASLSGIAVDHAMGFLVSDGEEVLGVACLTVEDVVRGGGFAGELQLHLPDSPGPLEVGDSFRMPPETPHIPNNRCSASGGRANARQTLSHRTRIGVRVTMNPGLEAALARQELRKLRNESPEEQSEVTDFAPLLSSLLRNLQTTSVGARFSTRISVGARSSFAKRASFTAKPYCDAFEQRGLLPPDRYVVHSRTANFLDFVTAILADAIGDGSALDKATTHDTVASLLAEGDFPSVLDMLREQNREGVRYWIDMFTMDPSKELENGELLVAMPTVARELQAACCRQMVRDIYAMQRPACDRLSMLMVLDKDCMVLQESEALAHLAVSEAMGIDGRILLQPWHLAGKGQHLASALRRVLDKPPLDIMDKPWAAPYISNQTELHILVKTLILKEIGVMQLGEGDGEGGLIGLTDVVAVTGAFRPRDSVRASANTTDMEVEAPGDVGE